jgi:hypothetical protein
VAPNGNDASAGTLTAPFRTIARGVSALGSGQLLYIRQGTYAESVLNSIRGGGASQYTTIAAYPGETVTLTGRAGASHVAYFEGPSSSYIELRDLNLDATVVTDGPVKITGPGTGRSGDAAHHIRIRGGSLNHGLGNGVLISQLAHHNEFLGVRIYANGLDTVGVGYNHGLYIAAPDNVVDGCEIVHNTGYAVHLYDGSAVPSAHRNVVRNNRIHDSAWGAKQAAIIAGSGDGNQVYNNVVYDSHGCVIIQYGPATNTLVANNTCVNTPGYGIYSNAVNTQIVNNLLVSGAGIANMGTATIQTNLVGVDPSFVSAGSKDFRLLAGSRAINAGTTVSAVTVDITSTPRPQLGAYDIGAHEYSGN